MSILGYPLVSFPGLGVDATILNAAWRAFVPQIKIVGAGTAPNYLLNQGRFMIANNVARVDMYFDGNGGTPGSGAGQLYVTLPLLPSPLRLGGFSDEVGYTLNNANYSKLASVLDPTSPWMPISTWATTSTLVPFTGLDQNNAIRTMRFHFWYECDLIGS